MSANPAREHRWERWTLTKNLTPKNFVGDPDYKWLGAFGLYGIAMLVLSVILLGVFSVKIYADETIHLDAVKYATFGAALWLLGRFCFSTGNDLWCRFDFVSKLIWVEMQGNYQSAQMDFGNVLSDRVKTQKQVINVESMTLRVWVAEIDSVAFGKDGRRQFLAMRGLREEAAALHAHLTSFGQSQSMIVAPTSQEDMNRAGALAALNNAQGDPNSAKLPGSAVAALIGNSLVPETQA